VFIMPARLIEPGPTPDQKREIPIIKDEFLIGRGADCDLRLPTSGISRHHCLIRVRAGEATVSDLGSSNGTFLNGQRIRSQAVLHSGDELLLDVYRFVVDLDDREGIEWSAKAAADPNTTTCKIRDVPPPKEPPQEKPI
jgi:pSer/pThr/pTyr-binding forkhead associated (FHA) protein